MTAAEMQELRDAVATYTQQDAHGGKLLAVLAERVIALDARVSDLGQATAPVAGVPDETEKDTETKQAAPTKSEKGG